MSRLTNQKMKPLYLAKILLERTDEENVMTAQSLVDALAAYDVQLAGSASLMMLRP